MSIRIEVFGPIHAAERFQEYHCVDYGPDDGVYLCGWEAAIRFTVDASSYIETLMSTFKAKFGKPGEPFLKQYIIKEEWILVGEEECEHTTQEILDLWRLPASGKAEVWDVPTRIIQLDRRNCQGTEGALFGGPPAPLTSSEAACHIITQWSASVQVAVMAKIVSHPRAAGDADSSGDNEYELEPIDVGPDGKGTVAGTKSVFGGDGGLHSVGVYPDEGSGDGGTLGTMEKEKLPDAILYEHQDTAQVIAGEKDVRSGSRHFVAAEDPAGYSMRPDILHCGDDITMVPSTSIYIPATTPITTGSPLPYLPPYRPASRDESTVPPGGEVGPVPGTAPGVKVWDSGGVREFIRSISERNAMGGAGDVLRTPRSMHVSLAISPHHSGVVDAMTEFWGSLREGE